MAISLMAGIYQYIQVFQTELVKGAYDENKKANGHSWSEMQCTEGLCVKDDKVGIGTDNPSGKLDVVGNINVDGKIMLQQETVNTDSSNTVVTKGYLSSFSSPTTKVIAGNNVVCEAGTDTLMKCIGTPCVWYDWSNNNVSGTIVKVMCGKTLTYDGTPLLFNEQHTELECTNAVDFRGNHGVIVAHNSGLHQCRFGSLTAPITSCPSYWGETGYSTTIPVAVVVPECGITDSGSHEFSYSMGIESATYYSCGSSYDCCQNGCKGFISCGDVGCRNNCNLCSVSCSRNTYTSERIQIGCY